MSVLVYNISLNDDTQRSLQDMENPEGFAFSAVHPNHLWMVEMLDDFDPDVELLPSFVCTIVYDSAGFLEEIVVDVWSFTVEK